MSSNQDVERSGAMEPAAAGETLPVNQTSRLTASWRVDLNWLPWVMAFAVWAQALYIVPTTIYWTLRSIHPIPFWDSWRIVKFLELGQPVTLSWLWSQDNEHRILIPRLITLIDYRFFRGCGYFDIALIWLMQIGSVLLITSLSFDVIGHSRAMRPWRILISGLIVCLAFASAQMENFYWAIQTDLVGMLFFSILAFFCLKQSTESHYPSAWIAGGALAAIASALCLASGMITILIFAALCCIAGARRRSRFVVVLFLVAFSTAYFHGYYNPNKHGSPTEALLHHRLLVIQYVFVYLGNVFRTPGTSGMPDSMVSAIVGSWGLALFVLAVLFVPSGRAQKTTTPPEGIACDLVDERHLSDSTRPASIALFSVAAVAIGQSILTALGRYGLGLYQAFSNRYVTPVSFFWIAVIVLVLALVLPERRNSTRPSAAMCILILLMVAQLSLQESSLGQFSAGRFLVLERAANALRVGVLDESAFKEVYKWPDTIVAARPFLLQHRLSIFSDNRYSMLGRQINDVASVSPTGACLGYFDNATHLGVEGGAKVNGWAWSNQEKAGPSQILLTDEAGTVVGLATGGLDRPDVVAAVPAVVSAGVGWEGYSKEARAVSAYALIDHGSRACRLTGVFDITPSTP